MAIDEFTKKRFDNVDKRVGDLGEEVSGLRTEMHDEFRAARSEVRDGLTNVVKGFELSLAAAATGIKQHIDGALAKAERIEELEARVAKLEALLSAGAKQ